MSQGPFSGEGALDLLVYTCSKPEVVGDALVVVMGLQVAQLVQLNTVTALRSFYLQ
jgi:hypothetical protein